MPLAHPPSSSPVDELPFGVQLSPPGMQSIALDQTMANLLHASLLPIVRLLPYGLVFRVQHGLTNMHRRITSRGYPDGPSCKTIQVASEKDKRCASNDLHGCCIKIVFHPLEACTVRVSAAGLRTTRFGPEIQLTSRYKGANRVPVPTGEGTHKSVGWSFDRLQTA